VTAAYKFKTFCLRIGFGMSTEQALIIAQQAEIARLDAKVAFLQAKLEQQERNFSAADMRIYNSSEIIRRLCAHCYRDCRPSKDKGGNCEICLKYWCGDCAQYYAKDHCGEHHHAKWRSVDD